LAEAKIAAKKGEVPVGAVLVHKKIIARFHNQ
jgi:tRNA(Arg) A34 adenosine deaminase TadA